MCEEIDIVSSGPYPAWVLSNLSPHAFAIDRSVCASMEGFLQSLKCADPERQARIHTMVGGRARKAGRGYDWTTTGELFWNGRVIDRFGPEYQQLLDRAYEALAGQSSVFRAALIATETATLTHSIGLTDPRQTVLTAQEFCDRLTAMRRKLCQRSNRDPSLPRSGPRVREEPG